MTRHLHVLDDASAVAREVGARLLARLAELQATSQSTVHVVLTGGSVADAVHREVADRLDGTDVDWPRVHLWFGDERFVDEEDDDRNALQARRALTGQLEQRGATVHEIPGTRGAGTPEESAALYAAELLTAGPGSFDLVMLGLGPDGHVASLFPGSPALTATGVAAGVHDSPKPPPQRVTLTFDRLNRSQEIWFMVTGAGKAAAVAAVLEVDSRGELPAVHVVPRGDVHWFMDEEAAPRP